MVFQQYYMMFINTNMTTTVTKNVNRTINRD